MNTIEKHLHEHFASLQDTDDIAPSSTTTGRAEMMGDSIPETLEEPFAKVNSVVANSPADSAGLKAGDEIRNFGYVNKGNHDGLKKVAECVQGNEGVSVNSVCHLEAIKRTSICIVISGSITNALCSKEYLLRYLAQLLQVRDRNYSLT